MARLNDFQVRDAPIPVDPQVMKRNSKSAAAQVDYRATKICLTELARHSDPFAEATCSVSNGSDRPSDNRNYGRDQAYVARWLEPDMTVPEASDLIETRLANRQRDSSTRPWWVTLLHYFRKLPAGACVRDCDPTVLSALMRELEVNLL